MSYESIEPRFNSLSRRDVLSLGVTAAGLTLATNCGLGAGNDLCAEKPIPMLMPRDAAGHQFLLYSDCCSGVPGAPSEMAHATVNKMVSRIWPAPEFIAFPGDAIAGYTDDLHALRAQWNYWARTEMFWLKGTAIPLYQSTSNHNTYDAGSEAVFREIHAHLPQNGPEEQRGLAYFIRDGNLLYISTHQPDRTYPYRQDMLIDTRWLSKVLEEHADARFKLVVGHYPVFPVNGYTQHPQWCFRPEERKEFWSVLVKHQVSAYLCSHILAFDVQVHDGLLQILSGGAGTGAMPPVSEYLHAAQMALDSQGLRCRVLNIAGQIRESFCWPFQLPPSAKWQPLDVAQASATMAARSESKSIVVWRFRGSFAKAIAGAAAQTLLCGWDLMEGCATVNVAFEGFPPQLIVRLVPRSGHGWQQWLGPVMNKSERFDFQLALHTGLGPGGVLYREGDILPWDSLETTSSIGAEQLTWPRNWAIGHAQSGPSEAPYVGEALTVTWTQVREPTVEE